MRIELESVPVPLIASLLIGFFQENLNQPSLMTHPNPDHISLMFIKLSNFVNQQTFELMNYLRQYFNKKNL